MVTLVVVGGCLCFLLVSTFVWALLHVRLSSEGTGEGPEGLLKAHAWAAAVPFVLVLVLIIASVMALLSSHTSGFDSLVSALGSTVVRLRLVVCALPSGVVVVLCVRSWLHQHWSTGQKLHYSAFVLVLLVSLVCLFAVGTG